MHDGTTVGVTVNATAYRPAASAFHVKERSS